MQRTCTNSSHSVPGTKSPHGMAPLHPEVICTSSSPSLPPLHTHMFVTYTPYSEKYVEIFATWQAKIYNVASRVPKWVFLVVSGSIGSLLIQMMHSWGKKKEKKPRRAVVKPARAVPPPSAAKQPVTVTATATASPAKTRSEGSPSGGRRRKARK